METKTVQELIIEIKLEIEFEGYVIGISKYKEVAELWEFILNEREKPFVVQKEKDIKAAIQEIKNLVLNEWTEQNDRNELLLSESIARRNNRKGFDKDLGVLIIKLEKDVEVLEKKRGLEHDIGFLKEILRCGAFLKNGEYFRG